LNSILRHAALDRRRCNGYHRLAEATEKKSAQWGRHSCHEPRRMDGPPGQLMAHWRLLMLDVQDIYIVRDACLKVVRGTDTVWGQPDVWHQEDGVWSRYVVEHSPGSMVALYPALRSDIARRGDDIALLCPSEWRARTRRRHYRQFVAGELAEVGVPLM
jgi:hypothetical protein